MKQIPSTNLGLYIMSGVGFEPTKHTQAILSRSPLTKLGKPDEISMTGLEPATPRLEVWCAIQLRHTDKYAVAGT